MGVSAALLLSLREIRFGLVVVFSFGFVMALVLWFVEDAESRSGGILGWTFGYCFIFLRLYYLPLHAFLTWPKPKQHFYSRHPVVWDDCCFWPFPSFWRLLLAQAESHGEEEINRLIDEYPAQRDQALRAKTIFVARRSASLGNLAQLGEALSALPEGQKGYLAETQDLRRKAQDVEGAWRRLQTLDRPVLAEPFAELLVKNIEAFQAQVSGYSEPLASEFRKAARSWLELTEQERSRVRNALDRQPTRQVFRAGDPVDRDREAFLFRGSLVGELERQVMLATGCPGLVIYGRRRMGKSTLIRNLQGFLPPQVKVVDFSMQEARAFDSEAAFVSRIEEKLLSEVEAEPQEAVNLMELEKLLARVNAFLGNKGQRLLLVVDEYENLDSKIGEGVFSEDVLAALRESMQSHRHLTWALVGSHRIEELEHAEWASYLVSARTVEVEPFSLDETHLLLTQPMKHSELWRSNESKRPSFEPGFWGEGGIDRIHQETGGWPHLVQLVAETTVDQINVAGQDQVDSALLERALDKSTVSGTTVFHQLVVGESKSEAEKDFLRGFAEQELQDPPDPGTLRALRRRLLVIQEGDQWRLRAPLMARWIRNRWI